MALREGDVVRFDYTLWLDDHKKPAETSMADAAKEHEIHDPERRYAPLTVTLGAHQIVPGLEKRLQESGEDDASFTADIPPGEAYGERDPKKIQDVPMAEFRKQKVKPEVGMVLNLQGQRAIVQRVAGGRVRLDLNHELAGHRLRYDVHIREVVADPTAKAQAVLESLFGTATPHTLEDSTLTVEVPDGAKFDREWPMHKFRVLTQLRQALGLDTTIKLVETYPAMKPDAGGEEE